MTMPVVFRSQSRVEYASEVDIVSMAATAQDHALARANIDGLVGRLEIPVHLHKGGADDPTGFFTFADEARQLVRKENLDTLFPSAALQSANDTGTVPPLVGRDQFLANRPFIGSDLPRYG